MTLFQAYPTYSRYRTLELLPTRLVGEDVYALQTALAACGSDPGPIDGILGGGTRDAIVAAQKSLFLFVDGKAGGATQEALLRHIATQVTNRLGIARGALRGQIEHESSFRVGNYSALHSFDKPGGPYYDAGSCQRNTHETPASEGFNVPKSVDALGRRVAAHFLLFAGLPTFRRWALAQGSWNAPAFACYLAKREGAKNVTQSMLPSYTPSAATLAKFETYVSEVTTYLTV